jgi:hypothetical protein
MIVCLTEATADQTNLLDIYLFILVKWRIGGVGYPSGHKHISSHVRLLRALLSRE